MNIKVRNKRALVSVTDKSHLVPLVASLTALGYEVVSTGGTARAIIEAKLECTQVADVTGYPEMMDGRVRTLHPAIFGGIIADRNVLNHMEAAAQHQIEMIDMVVVNMYDFAKRPCVNEIDVGGPSMLRAAAKNFAHVIVLIDPQDYNDILDELIQTGNVTLARRQALAEKVFKVTSEYDSNIYQHFRAAREAGKIVELGKHGG